MGSPTMQVLTCEIGNGNDNFETQDHPCPRPVHDKNIRVATRWYISTCDAAHCMVGICLHATRLPAARESLPHTIQLSMPSIHSYHKRSLRLCSKSQILRQAKEDPIALSTSLLTFLSSASLSLFPAASFPYSEVAHDTKCGHIFLAACPKCYHIPCNMLNISWHLRTSLPSMSMSAPAWLMSDGE